MEPEPGQVLGLVDIPEIEEVPAPHRPGDPSEIEVTELVPLRQDHERVGAFGGVVFVGAIDDRDRTGLRIAVAARKVGERQSSGVFHSLRIEHPNATSAVDEFADDGDGG